MAVKCMHIGVPVLDKKEGVTHNEDTEFWVSSMDNCDFKIEYLKFEGGTPLPEILSKQPHMAYRVDDLGHYAFQAQRITSGPADCGPSVRLAFVIWDNAIIGLYGEE